VRKSKLAKLVGQQAAMFAQNIKDRVDRAVHYSPKSEDEHDTRPTSLPAPIGAKVQPTAHSSTSSSAAPVPPPHDSHYMADTDSELHEV